MVSLLLAAGGGGAWLAYQKMGGTGQEKREVPGVAKVPNGFAVAMDVQRQDLARSLAEGKMPNTDAAFDQAREQIEKSSADGTTAEKASAMVASGYLEVVQELTNAHKASLQKLMDAKVFAFKAKDREMIAAHKNLLQEFIATNANLVGTITQRENAMRAGLEEAELPPADIEKITAEIKKTADRTVETELMIRGCDQALADAALKVLDVMDKNWDALTRAEANGDATTEQTDLWKQIG